MEVHELLIEVIVTGITVETIARTTYYSCKAVNLSMLDIYCLHIFNGSSTSETTIIVSY